MLVGSAYWFSKRETLWQHFQEVDVVMIESTPTYDARIKKHGKPLTYHGLMKIMPTPYEAGDKDESHYRHPKRVHLQYRDLISPPDSVMKPVIAMLDFSHCSEEL